jgi:RNA polymerase sigma-70 factor (ECF subfamily)
MTRNLLVDNFRRTRNQRATGSLDEGWESTEELKPIDRLTAAVRRRTSRRPQKELAKWCRTPWPASRWSCARRSF